MSRKKYILRIIIALLVIVSISSCRYGKILTDMDPEDKDAAPKELDSIQTSKDSVEDSEADLFVKSHFELRE